MTSREPRAYYDHEPVYQAIRERGGSGWDDRAGARGAEERSYDGLHELIAGPWLAGVSGLDVLDVGTGGGQSALCLAPLARRLVGVDYSPTAIALARQSAQRCGVDAEFFVADATRLDDFADASFDLVVDNHLLHCLVEREHRASFFDAVRRVLRPGGWFFSETMSRNGSIDLEALGIDPNSFVHANGTRYWTSTPEFNEELTRVGLRVVAQRLRVQQDVPPAGDLLWTLGRAG